MSLYVSFRLLVFVSTWEFHEWPVALGLAQPREHCWLPEESCMVMLTIYLKKLMCQLTSKYLDLFLCSGRCKYCVNLNNVIINDIINIINIINIIDIIDNIVINIIIGGCVRRDVMQIFL